MSTLVVNAIQNSSAETPFQITRYASTPVTLSGTSQAWTGIPSWVTRITITWKDKSWNAAGYTLVQVGYGAGPTWITSGYTSTAVYIPHASSPSNGSNTTGFYYNDGGASFLGFGECRLMLHDATNHSWIMNGQQLISTSVYNVSSGYVTMNNPLTAVRIYSTTGTDTFDNGTAQIFWEA